MNADSLSLKRVREKKMNALEAFVGKTVKVVYTEDRTVKIRKGKCLAADVNFITVETYQHVYGIPRASVTEIKTLKVEGAQ